MELLDGLDIIMLLTGLYAIPPALELAEKALVIHSKQLARRQGDRERSAGAR